MTHKTLEGRREYARKWRDANRESLRARCREYMREWRCRGDGWERDPTDFTPESDHQAAMWSKLLGAS